MIDREHHPNRLRIARLPPGRRTSYPHAESAEEEFVYVLEGTPDVWVDGHLHRLRPGVSVAFPAGTGICHSFLNNTSEEVRLLVIGEVTKPVNRIYYPLNESSFEVTRENRWDDWPSRPLGAHSGKPDASTAMQYDVASTVVQEHFPGQVAE